MRHRGTYDIYNATKLSIKSIFLKSTFKYIENINLSGTTKAKPQLCKTLHEDIYSFLWTEGVYLHPCAEAFGLQFSEPSGQVFNVFNQLQTRIHDLTTSWGEGACLPQACRCWPTKTTRPPSDYQRCGNRTLASDAALNNAEAASELFIAPLLSN